MAEKQPESLTYLDFSKTEFKNHEELQAALWKVPDLKLRYDRLWDEEVLCKMKGEYTYPNPVPTALRPVRLRDLSQVEIDWRMMTLLRPNTKLEEDIFTRMVQMERYCCGHYRYRLKMSNSAKSLMVKNPPRVRLTGGTARTSSNSKDDDSSDDNTNCVTLSYDHYCREVVIEEERVIDADMIMNKIAMASSTNLKKEKSDRTKKHRHSSKPKKDSSGNDKPRTSKTKPSGSKPTKNEVQHVAPLMVDPHVKKWVEESARHVREVPGDDQNDQNEDVTLLNIKTAETKKKHSRSNNSKRVRKKKA